MTDTHDPVRQLSVLQQGLSSDKRQIGFLLGAGCPMSVKAADGSPLILDIEGMTKAIVAAVLEKQEFNGHLTVALKHFEDDERPSPTIEDLLTHLRSLRAVAGKGAVRGLSAQAIDELDRELCENIHLSTNKQLSKTGTPYHGLAKWADGKRRGFAVEVFTTNYDLLLEQALEDQRVPYFDGFAGGRKPFFDLRAMEEDEIPDRWVRLWKLHGSVNWFQDGMNGVCRGPADSKGSEQRVIHPSHLKYQQSRRLPYLAMMDKLRSFFRKEAAILILCGYSFRDEHINEIIVQGLRASPSSVAFALQYDELSKYPEATALAQVQDNLNVLGQDAAVIGGSSRSWSEKDAEAAASVRSSELEWVPKDSTKREGVHKAVLNLGNFAVLGAFLQELTGANTDKIGGGAK